MQRRRSFEFRSHRRGGHFAAGVGRLPRQQGDAKEMASSPDARPYRTAAGALKRPRPGYPDGSPIADDEIAVWWLATDTAGGADMRRWFAMLDDDERARAARFHFDLDRREFIAGHALLRSMLSSYVDIPARGWRFLADENGKPKIDPGIGAPEIQFNLSHTRGLVTVAVASHGAIGVDAEKIDLTKADFAVAEAHFAPAEVEMLRRTPAADRPTRFFRLWTLKEAYVKAIGAGLNTPLDSFAFSFEPIRIEVEPSHRGDATAWRFASLSTTGEHVLSVAVGRPAGSAARFAPRGLAPNEV